MYEVVLTTRARKQLHLLPWKSQDHVIKLLLELKENPTGKFLERELVNQVGERMGVYRIVYKLYPKDRRVLVTRIGHREKVYN